MKTSLTYIDQIKEKHKLRTDKEVADMLDVSHVSIYQFREPDTSRKGFTFGQGVRVAKKLRKKPELVLLELAADREDDPDVKRAFKRASKIVQAHYGV